MNQNYTHITMVIDKSGSMENLQKDTIGGFNSFIKDQKTQPGKATITLVQFSTDYTITYSGVDIKDAPELTEKNYVPGGGTALLDALHKAIQETKEFINSMPEDEQPGRVVIVTITDGEENSSHEIKKEDLKKLVSDSESSMAWRFVFMGANIDSFSSSHSLGMTSANNSLDYSASSGGVRTSYHLLSSGMANIRAMSYSASVDSQTAFFEDPHA